MARTALPIPVCKPIQLWTLRPRRTLTCTPVGTAASTAISASPIASSFLETASPTPTPSPTLGPIVPPQLSSTPTAGSTPSRFARGAIGRLTAADYSSGEFFHYTYDAVGNPLRQEAHNHTNIYTYDIANRLISGDGVTYTWGDTPSASLQGHEGNLLSDGERTDVYPDKSIRG